MEFLSFCKKIFSNKIVLPQSNHYINEKVFFIQGPGDKEPLRYSLPEFENCFNLTYFAGLGFKNSCTLKSVLSECKAAIKSGFLKKEVLWFGSLYSNEIEQGFVNQVDIKWINEEIRFGLYAQKKMNAQEYIGEYTGLLRRYYPYWSNCNSYCYLYSSAKFTRKMFSIDAANYGNEIRFMNHSNTPNCETIVAFHNGLFHTCVRTLREISEGTQLCFDYGNDYLRQEKALPDI